MTLPSRRYRPSSATILLLLIPPIPSPHFHPTTVLTLPSGGYRIMPLKYMNKPSCHYHLTATVLQLRSRCYCPIATIPMLPSRRSCRDNTIQRLPSIMPLKNINKLSCCYDPLLLFCCYHPAASVSSLPFPLYHPTATALKLPS